MERALSAEIFWIELMIGRKARLANAQAFEGYVARQGERERLISGLEEMAGMEPAARVEAIAKGRPARWGAPWTKREEQTLWKLAGEGRSAAEIADELGRTIGGVEARLGTQPSKSARERPSKRRRDRNGRITIH